jgi:microcystin-dependent protein
MSPTRVSRRLSALRSSTMLVLCLLMLILCAAPAWAQSEPFIGQLALVPYNFAPRGWAFCNGQLLPINQNQALFSLLGTTFGGDGVTTFALPDLRGRVPISSGQGPGLSNYTLGEMGGLEVVTLTLAQIPAHTHAALCDTAVGSADRPAADLPARNAAGVPQYGQSANGVMSTQAIGSAGGGQPHENRQPFLTLNWIIALEGVFPTQNKATASK